MVILFFLVVDFWYQTDWTGGGGQGIWADTTKFLNKSNISYSRFPGNILLDGPDEWVNTSPLPGVKNIWALVETRDSVIYAGGDSAALKGFVFKSTDLGNTWINTDVPTCNWVHDLIEYHTGAIYAGTDQGVFKYDGSWAIVGLITDSINALIDTHDSVLYAGTWDGEIYKSTDGSSWSPVTVNNAFRIWDIIEAGDTLYACGTRIIGSNQFTGVFKSGDGVTFDTTCFPHVDRTVYALLFAKDSTIYAGTGPDSGKMFKTQDGGTTWDTTQTLEYAECVYSLLQIDYGTIYAGTGTLAGYLYKSSDGQTWAFEQVDASISNIYSLLQIFNGFLYVGTNKGSGSTTAVWKAGYFSEGWLKSSSFEASASNNVDYDSVFWDVELNGGSIEVWIRTNTAPDMWGVDSFQVMQPGDTIPSAFSDKGYVQYQVKLSSQNPDSTPVFRWIKIYYHPGPGLEEFATQGFDLQCYPNPVSHLMRIRYWIPDNRCLKESRIQLKVYDRGGRLLQTLVDEEKTPGYYQLDWDTEEIPDGVYFVRFKAGNYRKTKKLILLK